MKTTPRLVAVLVVLGILGAAAITIVRALPSRPRLVVKQPDGSEFRLEQVSVGRRHIDPFAPLSDQFFAYLPDSWSKKLGRATTARFQPGPTNFLCLWLSARTGNPPPAGQNAFDVLVGDGQGNWCRNTIYNHHRAQLPDGLWVEGVPLTSWPRRAENLVIQVHRANSSSGLVAEFTVRNPAPDRSSPRLLAGPDSRVAHVGDLDFTLTGLWTGVVGDSGVPAPGVLTPEYPMSPDRIQALSHYRITRNGQALTNWEAYHVLSARDGTGNLTDGNNWSRGINGTTAWNSFRMTPLPAGEPWHLRVEFSRVSGYEPAELWTAERIAISTNKASPSWGRPLPMDATNAVKGTIGNVKLAVFPIAHSQWSSEPTECEFVVRKAPDSDGYRLTLVRAVDDQGRELKGSESGTSNDTVQFRLVVLPDSKFATITLAHHASRYAEFIAEPVLFVPTNSPSARPR